MKKVISILNLTTLTVAGATIFYFGADKTKSEPSITTSTVSLQTVQQEPSEILTPTDTNKAVK